MTGREKLAKGDFNDMSQTQLPDGSVEITLSKRGERERWRLVVRRLYQPDEQVLSDEVVKE